jgi:hypothetical protein
MFAKRGGSGGLLAGGILIVLGGLLLARNFHLLRVDLGDLISTWWPLILIVIGVRKLAERSFWPGVVLVAAGGILQLLMLGWIDRWEVRRFWPLILIAIGVSMVLRPGRAVGRGTGA